ncbi:hypothetical protein FBZ89_114122 [Nitrospirillum amazonense]|uniref:Uncharacterized protein n=1 Tax=Nitrospirillum amazonense TaxID=28077 RepID=A0A560F1N4_9PROT|nr:hypothetical protein FBZ89_114122 [Nitrospirillum amazonense]
MMTPCNTIGNFVAGCALEYMVIIDKDGDLYFG